MKRFLIIAIVLVVVIAGFIMINRNQNDSEMQEQLDSLQTEAARIDSLVATIGETGKRKNYYKVALNLSRKKITTPAYPII